MQKVKETGGGGDSALVMIFLRGKKRVKERGTRALVTNGQGSEFGR